MPASKDHRYGIGAVAKLTGLSDHTIRVWERRYGAVIAKRAANGRRVYEPADVEKLGLLKALTDQGLSIGQIAGDTLDALRERADSLAQIAPARVPETIGIAVLGEYLPGQLLDNKRNIAPLEILVADTSRDRFEADLARHKVDVVVVESPVLDDTVTRQLSELMEHAGAARGVLAYRFGRARDVEHAGGSTVVTVRTPVDVLELRSTILGAYSSMAAVPATGAKVADTQATDWQFDGPVAPRRFNNKQLSRLARASTAIDCECPHHLAQLVGDLTAFEIYSAQCANRDDEDAALHRYLHQTTAEARALIEVALARVAEAEGIEY